MTAPSATASVYDELAGGTGPTLLATPTTRFGWCAASWWRFGRLVRRSPALPVVVLDQGGVFTYEMLVSAVPLAVVALLAGAYTARRLGPLARG